MGEGKEEGVGAGVGGDPAESELKNEEIVAVVEKQLRLGGGGPAVHPLPQRRYGGGHRVATHRRGRHWRRMRGGGG